MKIKVTADSTCDLSPELIEKNDIGIIPLFIIKDGVSYRDGIDIRTGNIFEHVRNGGDICTTAAVNVADYYDYFSEWLKEYDAIIHINISSEISACYQNAKMTAAELGNVYPVDSRNLSTASGHLVLDAAEMARAGEMTPSEIAEHLKKTRDKLDASFVIDTLDYLKKGGRCSALAAFGANMLNLKPCIEVHDGRMGVARKYRGSIEKSVLKYIEDRLKDAQDINYKRIFITHTCPDGSGLPDKARQLVESLGTFEEIHSTYAGCTISCHCGPGTLGILYFRT